MHKFFISTPLGLEDQSLIEIKQKWPIFYDSELPTFNKIEGGIELETDLDLGVNLNQILRSPNRILLRIKEQKCRDLPKLFKIITKINWKQYLKKESVSFSISCSESRLMHTGRIEKTCNEAMAKYFNANRIKKSVVESYEDTKEAQVFLRFDNDKLTISIDTSGELLYKRDYISFKGMAPLRNNYAYIMHEFLIQKTNIDIKNYTLIDPMCGSGTFLHEAKNRLEISKREFAFELFSTKKELIEKAYDHYKDYIGFDLDEVNSKRKLEGIDISRADLFDQKETSIRGPNVCIVNPPYGKKVKIQNVKTQKERSDYFLSIIHKCFEKFNCDYLGVIIPTDVKIKEIPSQKLKVFNNGIWINFCIYIRSSKNRTL